MKKLLNLILPFAVLALFTGCEDDPSYGDGETNFFSLNTKQMIVEVTPETTSFRIEGNWTENAEEQTFLRYYAPNSTAVPGEHFIYDYVSPEDTTPETMKFTVSGKTSCYHDITIIPENITSETTIYFAKMALLVPNEYENKDLINDIKVILRPTN